ncbi:hypothetical protein EYR40_007166 [Pleurotus pulmonarius]|nr:hypothetical protein EYR36_003551 [Pleurotus pulmonarius]KAF4600060.1 hypothetical protein EYR40_007166 [Pleurotus pulmonarius]
MTVGGLEMMALTEERNIMFGIRFMHKMNKVYVLFDRMKPIVDIQRLLSDVLKGLFGPLTDDEGHWT